MGRMAQWSGERYFQGYETNEFNGLNTEAVTDPLKIAAVSAGVFTADKLLGGSVVGEVAGVATLITGATALFMGGLKVLKDKFDVVYGFEKDEHEKIRLRSGIYPKQKKEVDHE